MSFKFLSTFWPFKVRIADLFHSTKNRAGELINFKEQVS